MREQLSREKRRLELFRLVHEIENENKSLVNLPSNSPKYSELRNLNTLKKTRKPMGKNKYDELQILMIEDKISGQIQSGYSIAEVAENLSISESWVRQTVVERELEVVKSFKYLITDNDTFNLYSTSKEGILRYFARLTHRSNLTNYIQAYDLKVGKFRWSQLPIKAQYIVSHNDVYILKVK